jgi:excisionase family DNA binding protein
LTTLQQAEVLRLAHALPEVFAAGSTTDKERKNVRRAVLQEVQLRKEGRDVHIKIIWKGGAVIDKVVTLPKVSEQRTAQPELVDLIRELAQRHTDAQIARVLARRRLKTPTGLAFNAHRVAGLRQTHGIECYRAARDREQDTYTVEQAAKLLEVGTHTIYLWLKAGLLKGDQVTAAAPWTIYLTEEDRWRLTAQDAPVGWLKVEEAARQHGVSKQAVLNWVKEGKIAYVYVTKGRRRGLRVDGDSSIKGAQPGLF